MKGKCSANIGKGEEKKEYTKNKNEREEDG